MPALFERDDVRFQYPENWSLEEGSNPEGDLVVGLESPGGALWTLVVRRPGEPAAGLARAALSGLESEYEDLEFTEVQEQCGPHALAGFDVDFVYLDMTVTAAIRCLATPAATYLVVSQAEDRELRQVAGVFRALLASLLRDVPG